MLRGGGGQEVMVPSVLDVNGVRFRCGQVRLETSDLGETRERSDWWKKPELPSHVDL